MTDKTFSFRPKSGEKSTNARQHDTNRGKELTNRLFGNIPAG